MWFTYPYIRGGGIGGAGGVGGVGGVGRLEPPTLKSRGQSSLNLSPPLPQMNKFS